MYLFRCYCVTWVCYPMLPMVSTWSFSVTQKPLWIHTVYWPKSLIPLQFSKVGTVLALFWLWSLLASCQFFVSLVVVPAMPESVGCQYSGSLSETKRIQQRYRLGWVLPDGMGKGYCLWQCTSMLKWWTTFSFKFHRARLRLCLLFKIPESVSINPR